MVSEGEALQSAPTFAGLGSSPAEIDAAQFVVIPVPYECTTEWLAGTRFGPSRIIESSRLLELYDHVLEADISLAGVVTASALEPVLASPEAMVAAVKAEVASWLVRGKTPVLLGGEHTITLGAVQAMRRHYPNLSVLQLDAHADLRDEYLGTRYSQATVMRRVHECCPIAQAGIRALSNSERAYIAEQGIRTIFWPPREDGWQEALIDSLSEYVYVTIDADVFDIGIMPCVGTPEPGGPGWDDIQSILRMVALHRHVVGFDVVELCPHGHAGDVCAYALSKLIFRFIGSIYNSRNRQEASHHG